MKSLSDISQLESGRRPDVDDPPEVVPEPTTRYDPYPDSLRDIHNHNPWAPDPDDGDIRTIHFNSGGNTGGGFSFTRSYTFGGHPDTSQIRRGSPQNYHDAASAEIMRNFESMFTGLLAPAARLGGGHFGGQIHINGRTTTFGSGSYTNNTTGGPATMNGPGYDPSYPLSMSDTC